MEFALYKLIIILVDGKAPLKGFCCCCCCCYYYWSVTITLFRQVFQCGFKSSRLFRNNFFIWDILGMKDLLMLSAKPLCHFLFFWSFSLFSFSSLPFSSFLPLPPPSLSPSLPLSLPPSLPCMVLIFIGGDPFLVLSHFTEKAQQFIVVDDSEMVLPSHLKGAQKTLSTMITRINNSSQTIGKDEKVGYFKCRW